VRVSKISLTLSAFSFLLFYFAHQEAMRGTLDAARVEDFLTPSSFFFSA
jgi:hypothetical protein